MKSAVAFLAFSAVLGAVVSASGYSGGGASSGGYGAASIPAPPCPKNYLFSCQPNLSPAPCAPAAGGYGGAGAYSDNVPTVVSAPYPGYQGTGYPLNTNAYPNFYGHGGASPN